MIIKDIKIKRSIKPTVTKDWINWLNDHEVTKYSCQRLFKHSFKTQNNYVKKKINEKKTIFFHIFFKKKKIGIIVLTKIDKFHQNCEINYLIGDKLYWGRGIATHIIKLTSKYAFNYLKMKKIYTCIYSNNIASKKALIKNNFKIEGSLKSFYKFGSNRIDKIYLGLTKK